MSHSDMPDLAGRDPSKSGVAKLIAWSIANRLIVLLLAAALSVAGWLAIQTTPLDAVPDLTDTQVIIRTDFPGQSPQIVEDLVTAAFNDARDRADRVSGEEMAKIQQDVGLPPGFKLPGM